MKKQAFIVVVMCLVMVFSLAGCVKVVQIGHEGDLTGDVAFNAAENVADLWESQAIPLLQKEAVDLPQFLTESNGNLKALAKKYGRYSMGDKGELSYVVKGQGKVMEVNREKKAGFLLMKIDGYDGPTIVKLQIGTVYKGSAVRDRLEFIKYEDYKNQVDWAKVSQSIHDVVNKKIIEKLDMDTLKGKNIKFIGCFTVDKADEILITPVEVTVQ
ncbi:MAG: DUF2291 domain-containing protein [Selenomonadaceae bacterium]